MKTNRLARWIARHRLVLGCLITAAVVWLEFWGVYCWQRDVTPTSTPPDTTPLVWNAAVSASDLLLATR